MMGRTPFYRTSNELEHHLLNIERTRTCSLIISRTSIEHRTNIEHFCYFDVHNNYYSKSSIWTFCEELEEDSILLLIIEISFSVS